MSKRRRSILGMILVQGVVLLAFAVAWALPPRESIARRPEISLTTGHVEVVKVPRTEPLSISSLYDDPTVIGDQELTDVLRRLRPRFSSENLKPNHVEHALREWGALATFRDPQVMSGRQMIEFLTNHGEYLKSWGSAVSPLLIERQGGVAIRWGKEEGASVHHDHWLACLTEAGVTLDQPIYGPSRRNATLNSVLQESLRDFRVDEKEVEWSAMAFGLWLPPVKSWRAADGREMSFDLIARRLARGHQKFGTCSGTHRAYSLMLLIRLDDQYQILSADVRDEAFAYLKKVRDRIIASQNPDGSWPANWMEGKEARENPENTPLYKVVIATGHHLEWLAIAPAELHPPREAVRKAARWLIDTVKSRSEDELAAHFTFYSHVGNALSLWRGTRPAEFWSKHEATTTAPKK